MKGNNSAYSSHSARPLPTSLQDQERLAALADTGLPDSPPEEAFDRLTRIVTRLLGVPVALVSLVDDRRQFSKACKVWPDGPESSGKLRSRIHSVSMS